MGSSSESAQRTDMWLTALSRRLAIAPSRVIQSGDIRILSIISIAVIASGMFDGSRWTTLLAPTLAYRPAVLFALTLLFGWRGLLWSQFVFLLLFTAFFGWRGVAVPEPAYLISYTGAFIVARWLARQQPWLSRQRATLAFLVGAMLAPTIPALLYGPIVGTLGLPHNSALPDAVDGWLRQTAAILAIAPAVLVYGSGRLKEWAGQPADHTWSAINRLDILALVLEMSAWTVTLWATAVFKATYGLNITYLTCFPPLAFTLYKGMRLGAAALAGNAIIATTLWSLMHWDAFLPVGDLRLLIGIYSLTVLVLAAVVDEREIGRKQLEATITDLRTANDETLRAWQAVNEREERLREAQKMEAIGRMAGGVAHDFNNLLTVINGFSELLLNETRLNDDTRTGLLEIHRAGRKAQELTSRILTVSRGQVREPAALSLQNVIEEDRKILTHVVGEGVELVTVFEAGTGHVNADRTELTQILLNLAANARDAMPMGGRITLAVCNVSVNEGSAANHPGTRPGTYVLLTVTDNGSGMDDETRRHVFEPFFTTKAAGMGTGLGLATVYGIVSQRRGWIEVESRLDVGTTFRIYLPMVPAGTPDTKDRPERENNLHGSETVMVVEDDPNVRNLACLILKNCGYQILEASNGEEALHLANTHEGPWHLLITDLVMPGIQGPALASRLQAIRHTPVLFMSAYAGDLEVRQDFEVAYIQKPFTPDSLARKARDLLNTASPSVEPQN